MKKIQFFLIFNFLFASEIGKYSNINYKAMLIQRWWKNSIRLKQKLFYDISDVRRKLLNHNGLATLGSSNIFTGCNQLPPVKLTINSMREELKARNAQLKILNSNAAKSADN